MRQSPCYGHSWAVSCKECFKSIVEVGRENFSQKRPLFKKKEKKLILNYFIAEAVAARATPDAADAL